jgi:hypothetical protein
MGKGPRSSVPGGSQDRYRNCWINKFLDVPPGISIGGAKQYRDLIGSGRLEAFTQTKIINMAK